MERQTQPATREGYLNEAYHYFHLRDTAGQERSFHFHEFDKLVLLRAGRVSYIVENTTCELVPGSVLIVPHHAIHKAVIDQSEAYDRIIIYLDRRAVSRLLLTGDLQSYLNQLGRSARLLLPGAERRRELERTTAEYEELLQDNGPGAAALRDTLMLQLLVRIGRIATELHEGGPENEAVSDPRIRQVLSCINSQLTEDLSVDTLSASVYLSRYHFMRLFREQTGTTVHAYIRQKRLLHAARLIRQGTPAGQAAAESGFPDYSAFHRAFRQSFGISPSELLHRSDG